MPGAGASQGETGLESRRAFRWVASTLHERSDGCTSDRRHLRIVAGLDAKTRHGDVIGGAHLSCAATA